MIILLKIDPTVWKITSGTLFCLWVLLVFGGQYLIRRKVLKKFPKAKISIFEKPRGDALIEMKRLSRILILASFLFIVFCVIVILVIGVLFS